MDASQNRIIRLFSRPALPVLFFVAVLLTSQLIGFVPYWNRAVFDKLVKWEVNTAELPEDAVIVVVDDKALKEVSDRRGYRWPWRRDVFAGIIAVLHQAGASAIVMDFTFFEESEDPEHDLTVGAVAAACPEVILATLSNQVPIIWQDNEIKAYLGENLSNRIGNANFQPDPDGIVRRYYLPNSLVARALDSEENEMQVTWPMLRWYGTLNSLRDRGKVFSAEMLALRGVTLIDELKKKNVNLFSPEEIANELKTLEPISIGGQIKGKVVFVGASASAIYDVKAMAIGEREPGVLAHYTAWANGKQNAFIEEAKIFGKWDAGLFLACLYLATLVVFGWQEIRPLYLVLFSLGALCFFFLLTKWLFDQGIFLQPAALVQAMVLGVIAVTARNWWLESKSKRTVQELFGNYVSKEVVDELLEDPEKVRLGGEKKELTVYFSDVAGFTDLSEELEPEALVEIVNQYLSELSGYIIDQDGYLDKYIGDAIMGVFGAPQPLDNHALSACVAAIRSRDHLKELSQRLKEKAGRELHARYGINTGEMIVGNFGSERKMNYTVVGDAVNLAARLEAANKQFGTTILIGERTQEQAGSPLVTRPVDLLAVKGKIKPVQTYEVLGLREELKQEKLVFSEQFSEAYVSYRKFDFQKAKMQFDKIGDHYPTDQLCQIYQKRCQQFIKEPPDPDWDGVHRMTTK